MTMIHIHKGGGCEAIVKEDGNELFDLHVHHYLCKKKPKFRVFFPGGFEKLACEKHAKGWMASHSKVKVERLAE